jgi:SAM-dependent methyltransferase
MEPKLSRESLQALYNSDVYWNVGRSGKSGARLGYSRYPEEDGHRLRQAGVRLNTVRRFVPVGSKILDVACATGVFVKVARDGGMDARGVDLSSEMAKAGREAYGIEIEPADFVLMPAGAGPYDVITMWGADSNFYDPREAYAKAHALLRPNGFLFLNFWDFDHVSRRLLGDFKIGPSALYNFNRSNLQLILEKTGFRIVDIAMERQYATLEAISALTDRRWLRALIRRLGWQDRVIRTPTLSGFLVAAQRNPDGPSAKAAR